MFGMLPQSNFSFYLQFVPVYRLTQKCRINLVFFYSVILNVEVAEIIGV